MGMDDISDLKLLMQTINGTFCLSLKVSWIYLKWDQSPQNSCVAYLVSKKTERPLIFGQQSPHWRRYV